MAEKKLTKKEKVLICATVVGAGVAGYFGIKYFNSKKLNLKNVNDALKDDLETIMEIEKYKELLNFQESSIVVE